MTHERKCWDCGYLGQFTSDVVPGVLCPKCGSQDTRRRMAEQATADAEASCPYCGASNTGLAVVDWQCWECGSWRKINGAERRSEICRSGEIAAMRAKIVRLTADLQALYEERQTLRDILSVALPASSGTTTAEFGACYSLVESAKLLAAKVAALEAEIKGVAMSDSNNCKPAELLVPAALYDEALAFCNARRADVGLEPITELPAGYGGSPTTCPCANGAGLLYVNRDWWSLVDECQRFSGTPIGFIDFFDWYTNYGVLTLPVRDDSLKEESRND